MARDGHHYPPQDVPSVSIIEAFEEKWRNVNVIRRRVLALITAANHENFLCASLHFLFLFSSASVGFCFSSVLLCSVSSLLVLFCSLMFFCPCFVSVKLIRCCDTNNHIPFLWFGMFSCPLAFWKRTQDLHHGATSYHLVLKWNVKQMLTNGNDSVSPVLFSSVWLLFCFFFSSFCFFVLYRFSLRLSRLEQLRTV